MVNEDKELFKFVNDPKYREKVIARIHREKDAEYNRRIKQAEMAKNNLIQKRSDEINRISNFRWQRLFGSKLLINRTEGKVRINNTECLFSSIQGAELNVINGCRVVTIDNSKSKSKKHTSLGGAFVGGMVAGPIGAVVAGSALGKTTTKTTGRAFSNQIPTCTHLGVLVNLDGFVSEVVFISSEVDQSSLTFSRAQSDAQNFISRLRELALTPVPKSFLRPDEESSVKTIEAMIANKEQELQAVIADKPVYALPDMYRMKENRDLSDAEYMHYLISTDAQRLAEKEANEAAFKQEQAEKKAAEKARRAEEKEARRLERAQKIANGEGKELINTIGGVITKIVLWIISLSMLLFAAVSFSNKNGVLSGVLFCAAAIWINPLLTRFIKNAGKRIPIWLVLILEIVLFLAGVFTYPT